MKIEFNTENASELNAIAALVASLGGVLPTTTIGTVAVDLTVDPERIATLAKEAATVNDVMADDPASAFGKPETAASPPPHGGPAAAAPPPPVTTPTPAPAAPTAPAASPTSGETDITADLVPSTGPTDGALMNAHGVEVDKAGLPYDSRIHTKEPKIKKDGFWTLGRGVDKDLVREVVAELKTVMASGGNVTTAAPAVAAIPTPAPGPAATAPEAAAVETAASVPAPPAAPVAPPPAAPGAVENFAGLMKKVTGMQTASQLTVAQVSEIAVSLGLTGIKDLIKRPDLVAAFDALLPDAA